MVPGSWEAQGYGNETEQMRKQVLTGDSAKGSEGAVGIYTKTVTLPPCSVAGAKAVFTVDQGIHRHAIFKFGHNIVGEHRGYLTPFEAEIETGEVEIEITLDGGRPCNKGGCADALMGTQDDDIALGLGGSGIGGWAGLNGHVAVECRPPVFIDGGVGSIVPPHIQHPPVTASSAGEPLTLSADFVITGGAAMAAVQIVDNSSGTPVVVAHNQSMAPMTGEVSLQVTLPAVKLWSPEQRALYTAVGTTPYTLLAYTLLTYTLLTSTLPTYTHCGSVDRSPWLQATRWSGGLSQHSLWCAHHHGGRLQVDAEWTASVPCGVRR
jgi:hypothetical protein